MIKIVLNEKHLYNTCLGLLMALNYAIEGLIMYGIYLVINHWYVSGNEMFFWLVGGIITLFIRGVAAQMIAEEYNSDYDYDVRAKQFNFHWLQVWRIGLTILDLIKKIPLSIEIRSEDK